MAILPWELIIDILSRVPVKDLLRYRSVARPWKSLIDGPDFIKLHLTHSLQNPTTSNSNLSVFLKSPQGFHIFDLDSLNPAARPLGLPTAAAAESGVVEVIGCLNGLVALAAPTGNAALWNPATRRYRELPFSDFKDFSANDTNAVVVFTYGPTGFGYDPALDDHKLLIAALYCDPSSFSIVSSVRVYSVNSRAWRTVDGFPIQYSYHRNSGVSVGGSLNWMGTPWSEEDGVFRIVGFDLSTEEFREIPVPDLKGNGFYLKLVDLRGCLSLERNINPQQYSERVEIWVMKDYGVKESWTKLFSVAPSVLIGNFTYAVPVVYLDDPDRVLVDIAGEKFLSYDLKKKKAENFGVSDLPRDFQAYLYVGSLLGVDGVRPKAGGDGGNKRTKPKRGKKREDFLSKGFKLVL